jgi:hypothetical protein
MEESCDRGALQAHHSRVFPREGSFPLLFLWAVSELLRGHAHARSRPLSNLFAF